MPEEISSVWHSKGREDECTGSRFSKIRHYPKRSAYHRNWTLNSALQFDAPLFQWMAKVLRLYLLYLRIGWKFYCSKSMPRSKVTEIVVGLLRLVLLLCRLTNDPWRDPKHEFCHRISLRTEEKIPMKYPNQFWSLHRCCPFAFSLWLHVYVDDFVLHPMSKRERVHWRIPHPTNPHQVEESNNPINLHDTLTCDALDRLSDWTHVVCSCEGSNRAIERGWEPREERLNIPVKQDFSYWLCLGHVFIPWRKHQGIRFILQDRFVRIDPSGTSNLLCSWLILSQRIAIHCQNNLWLSSDHGPKPYSRPRMSHPWFDRATVDHWLQCDASQWYGSNVEYSYPRIWWSYPLN